MKLYFLQQILKKPTNVSNFMKIFPVTAESIHVDGQTHVKGNSRFSPIFANAPTICAPCHFLQFSKSIPIVSLNNIT